MSEHLYQELKLWEDKDRPISEEERLDAVVLPLCRWYEKEKRDLPWRRERNPYHIWISEIMLQQTRVEAVKPYYERFMSSLPDVKALAQAEDESLMKLWEGLGYYSRARNLKKAALICAETYGGRLPESYEELLTLPGIGSYTAGAIASIAYGQRKPAVDGNVLRVVHRLLACRDDIMSQKVKKTLEGKLEKSMLRTKADAGTYNQALMELGACVCIPNGQPQCGRCPLERLCLANRENLTGEIPCRKARKPRRIEERTVFLVTDGERIVLRQRPESGLLAGLFEPPQTQGTLSESEAEEFWRSRLLAPAEILKASDGVHVFSHVEWHMTGWQVRIPDLLSYRNRLEEMGCLVVEKEKIHDGYAIPKAFSSWKEYWEVKA